VNGVQPNQQASLDEVTNQLVQSLLQGNQGSEVTGSPQRTSVNGADARSVTIRAISPLETKNGKQIPERDWIVTMDGGNNTVIYAVFTAPEQDFSALRPTFEEMLRSFRIQQ
jgi:hypothetical protein